MGSLFGTILGTVLDYKRDPYVYSSVSLSKANTDSNSHDASAGHWLGADVVSFWEHAMNNEYVP